MERRKRGAQHRPKKKRQMTSEDRQYETKPRRTFRFGQNLFLRQILFGKIADSDSMTRVVPPLHYRYIIMIILTNKSVPIVFVLILTGPVVIFLDYRNRVSKFKHLLRCNKRSLLLSPNGFCFLPPHQIAGAARCTYTNVHTHTHTRLGRLTSPWNGMRYASKTRITNEARSHRNH